MEVDRGEGGCSFIIPFSASLFNFSINLGRKRLLYQLVEQRLGGFGGQEQAGLG